MRIKDFKNTSEYYTFNQMKQRIFNPNHRFYKDYGGRGLVLDKRYSGKKGFFNFIRDIGIKPCKNMTLDRIDNTKSYVFGNIRWATRKEQALNRRSNHFLTFKNKTKTIHEWGEELGIRPKTLLQRINEYKWTVEKALTTPTQKHVRKKLI